MVFNKIQFKLIINSSRIREHSQFRTGRAQLLPHMNEQSSNDDRKCKWQMALYRRQGEVGEEVGCRERAGNS